MQTCLHSFKNLFFAILRPRRLQSVTATGEGSCCHLQHVVTRRSSHTSNVCGACSSRLVAIIRTGLGPPGTPRVCISLFLVACCFLRVRQSGVPQVRPLLFQSATRFSFFLSLSSYQANRQPASAIALATFRGCASVCSVELPFTFPLALSAAMGLELDHSKSFKGLLSPQ